VDPRFSGVKPETQGRDQPFGAVSRRFRRVDRPDRGRGGLTGITLAEF